MFYVAIIVAIGCATAVLSDYFKARAAAAKPKENSDETLKEIAALEERIKVLERIVTENRFDLRKEIDRL
jgi:hypothetical protein